MNVSNDVTAAMLTERFFGQGGPNMLFVRIERGIGSAILLSDTPVIGELHAAGEIGHISIDLDGPLCPCGKRGCLETMISGTALKKQLSAADVEQHQNILARAGRYLGQALSMPVGLLDMADVCVYGQPNIINETFIDAAQQYLDAATSSSFHKHTVIRRCECGPDITVQGEAIAVVFQHLAKIKLATPATKRARPSAAQHDIKRYRTAWKMRSRRQIRRLIFHAPALCQCYAAMAAPMAPTG